MQCFPTIFRKSTQLGLSVPRDRTAATYGDAPSSKCYFSRMYAVIQLMAFNVLAWIITASYILISNIYTYDHVYRVLGSLVKRYNFQVFHCHFVNAFITLTSFTHKVSHLTLPLLITLLFVTIQKHVARESYRVSGRELGYEIGSRLKVVSSEIVSLVTFFFLFLFSFLSFFLARKFRI